MHMMDIKSQLIGILKKENYTFTQLAEYLGMSEENLTSDLNNKTLELRKLELISKELRVPLYSFFREENERCPSADWSSLSGGSIVGRVRRSENHGGDEWQPRSHRKKCMTCG